MNSLFATEKQIFSAVWNRKFLWFLHLIANSAFLLMIYAWLSIPDRTIADLVLSAASGLAIVLLVLWVHSATLTHFRSLHAQGEGKLRLAFLASLRNLPAFLIWALLLVLVLWAVFRLNVYQEEVSNWTASLLSFRLRRPISPAQVSTAFHWMLVLIAFVLVPFLLLPWGEQTATNGFRAFRWNSVKDAGRTLMHIQYWLACLPLLVVGLIVPYEILWWLPDVKGLVWETASIAARFLAACMFAVLAWLLIASMLGLLGSTKEPG